MSNKEASCHLCSSPWKWTGSCELSTKEDLRRNIVDLNYADDIGLQSCKHQDEKQKAEFISKTANTIGLKVNTKKTQVLRMNIRLNDPALIHEKHLEDADEFSYLGTNVTQTEIMTKKLTPESLKPTKPLPCRSLYGEPPISKIKIILQYGAECWKTTATIQQKLGVADQMPSTHSQNLLAQHHLKLRNRTGIDTLAETMQTQQWRWLGHDCRMPSNTISRTAPRWKAQGKRKTKRDMAAHRKKKSQYQGTESQHGPQSSSSSRPSQMENPCCRLTCQTAQRG